MATKETKNVLPDLAAFEEMKRKLAETEAALAAEKAKKANGFGIEIGDKGCVVIRLGGGFPVSMYGDKLNMLIDNFDTIREFAEQNKNRIKAHKGA